MSKVAILTDTHYGWKNDSSHFQDYFRRFYDDVFFPTLESRNIKTILHLGDLMDRRKYINFLTLHRTRREFLERLDKYETQIVCGNHDVYFKDTNEVNCLRELIDGRYKNITFYEEPKEISLDGLPVLLVPWLNTSNMEAGLEMISNSQAPVLMGHLEIAGFRFDRSTICEHGLDRNIFRKFKRVFSGHFHTKSMDGNIDYLGAPYQMTFGDVGDIRGFHIFDTETLEVEFIQNPYDMFHRLTYDDREEADKPQLLISDFSKYEGRYVKVTVTHKTDPYLYDQWLTRLEQTNPHIVQIVEHMALEVDAEAEEQFGTPEDGEVVLSDTMTILNKYVDSMGVDMDKPRLKAIFNEIYIEAINVVEN